MIAVVSQSQMRIGTEAMPWSRTPRCVWARWRKRVTHTFVRCPAITTNNTGIHHRLAHAPNSGMSNSTCVETTPGDDECLNGDKRLRTSQSDIRSQHQPLKYKPEIYRSTNRRAIGQLPTSSERHGRARHSTAAREETSGCGA